MAVAEFVNISDGLFDVSAETVFRLAYASAMVANWIMVMASMIGGEGIGEKRE